MINWDAVSYAIQQYDARQQRIGTALQGLADHLADDDEGQAHETPRRPVASPRRTLGTVLPASGPRPPVTTYRHAALSPQQFAAVNGQAAPSLPPVVKALA